MTDPAVKVKTERPDEAEIRELAAKMVEANKAKALAATAAAAARPPGGMVGVGTGPGGQMGIMNFLTRKPGAPTPAVAVPVEQRPSADNEKKTPAPDEASWKGHFGWDMLGKCHIPYIYRSGEKYVAVRMVEIKLLNKYLNYLHHDIYSCTCIRSYYITEIEARLLNEINNKHCDSHFGREMFTQKDLVVRLSDAYEFYNFLDVCYNKLLRGSSNNGNEKCGFIRINKESVVPYTVRDNQKFVPLFYFEGETDNLKLKADQLKGWDLSYLKFCCKVQGIRNELFASETCAVISLTDIKGYFPPGTEFEEYWPHKVVDSQFLIVDKGGSMSSRGGQWTRAPPAPPPGAVGGAGGLSAAAAAAAPSNRGRRANPALRNTSPAAAVAAAAAMQMPHAAAVQALANGWNLPGSLTQAQTQQVLRIAQAQVAQAQAAARYNSAALAAAAAMPQHRSQHQRTVQFPNSSVTMSMSQQQPPPLVRNSNNPSMNVQQLGVNGHDSRKKLTPIPDINVSGSQTPYRVQKALVENMMVPCINLKPHQYNEQLMTLPDLASNFFPRVSLTNCRAMLDALGFTLYRPNSIQLQVLRSCGKCKSAAAGDNGMALVLIKDVMQHMPQIKYMLRSAGDEAPRPAPRPAHRPATNPPPPPSATSHPSHPSHTSHPSHASHPSHHAKRARAN